MKQPENVRSFFHSKISKALILRQGNSWKKYPTIDTQELPGIFAAATPSFRTHMF
jgi:hypothetical protein